MSGSIRKSFLLILAIVLTALAACYRPADNEWRKISGPSDPHSLVIFLQKGNTNEELNFFVEHVIGNPSPDGKGHDLADGLAGTMLVRNSGYEGYAVDFDIRATPQQRADLKRRIAESPLVYVALEYVVPDQIRLPGDREFSRKGFPKIWFALINDPNKPDWEILPQEAKPGEVILSKRNELGILSNFAATPFELDGKRYASVEGFWQMMLYPEGPDDERAKVKGVEWKFTREQIAQMTAFEAKSAGTLAEENMKKLAIDWCTYQGKRFLYRSQTPREHYRLIVAAMRVKMEQNPEVKRILLATGDLILKPDHHGDENPPPEWKYYEIWMQIRSELQRPAR